MELRSGLIAGELELELELELGREGGPGLCRTCVLTLGIPAEQRLQPLQPVRPEPGGRARRQGA